MTCDQSIDFADLFATLFSSREIGEFPSAEFIRDTEINQPLRLVIVSLLNKIYPKIQKPNSCLGIVGKTYFDKALLSLLSNTKVAYARLSFLEKLIVCNLSFIFDCVDEEEVWSLAGSLTKTFSQKNEVLTLFLLKENDARSKAFLLFSYTLLDLSVRGGIVREDAVIREKFYDAVEGMEKCFDSDFEVLAESIYLVTRNTQFPIFEDKKREACNSLFSCNYGSLDLLFSFSGENQGVGSFAFNHLKVASFGPQVLDLGQTERYGITFDPSDDSHFKIKADELGYSGRGWGRLHGDRDVWVEHDFRVKEDFLELYISFENFNLGGCEVSECFYVCADEVRVDGKIVQRGSLNRYQSIAKKVELKVNDEIVEISILSDALCQVIPLAGGGHYWGADFIIAFEPENLKERMHLSMQPKVF